MPDINPATRNSTACFLIAFGLLNVLSFTLLFCGLSFIGGFTVAKWQFPMGCVSALVSVYYAVRFFSGGQTITNFFKSGGIVLGLVLASVLIAGFFYDVSYDGQWYHQETVYRLKQGYNPVYQTIAVPRDEVNTDARYGWCSGVDKPMPAVSTPVKASLNGKYLAINNFSKGSEVIQTAIYQFTGRIEAGKAVNIMLLTAAFFLCLSLLYKIDRITIWKKWLIAVLAAFNPVVIIQTLTFCVDGNLGSILLCLLAISCILFVDVNRYHLFLLGSVIVIAINIKFTGAVFTAMYGIGLILMLLIYKKNETLKKVSAMGIIAGIIGVFCCGTNPYVTNVIEKHNLFYGLEQTRETINSLTPPVLIKLNRFEKLFFSLSAHQGWHSADAKSLRQIPKIPFTFNTEDIRETNDAEQELSGFGPFFSGALLIIAVLFVVVIVRSRKTQAFKLAMSVFVIILATIIIMPDSWWARFVPQFWLLPVIILFTGEFIVSRGIRFLQNIAYLSLGLNVVWALLSIVYNLFLTVHINYQMKQLKVLNQPVVIEYCPFNSFKSNRVRFIEAGIPFTEKNVTGKNIYNVITSNTRFATAVPLPDLPKPFLLKFSDKVNGVK